MRLASVGVPSTMLSVASNSCPQTGHCRLTIVSHVPSASDRPAKIIAVPHCTHFPERFCDVVVAMAASLNCERYQHHDEPVSQEACPGRSKPKSKGYYCRRPKSPKQRLYCRHQRACRMYRLCVHNHPFMDLFMPKRSINTRHPRRE